jgi:hypothetical protein
MEQFILKDNRNFIFYRAYCLITAVVWTVVGFWQFAQAVSKQQPPDIMLFLIPFVIPAIFMVFSWAIFPWDYSIFGRYKRKSFPNEEPIYTKSASWGKIAWFHASIPFFSWRVYRLGLGISVFGVGKVFIPVSNIEDLESGFIKGYKLRHNSPELRNPVTLPNKKIFEAVQEILKRR